MKRATQRETFAAFQSMLEAYGVVEYSFKRCGCARMVFKTGGVKRESCALHKYTFPRTCPCGYNDQLTQQTSIAHRLGDVGLVEDLRRERVTHYAECTGD